MTVQTLTDLNDFIAPSQACIKPVEQANPQKDLREAGAATVRPRVHDGATLCAEELLLQTEIRIDTSGSYYEVSAEGPKVNGAGKKLEQAQISLNDCLACRYVVGL